MHLIYLNMFELVCLYVRIDGMMGMFQDGVMYPAMWALCHTH